MTFLDRPSALVPRSLAARPSCALSIYCGLKEKKETPRGLFKHNLSIKVMQFDKFSLAGYYPWHGVT